jgi:acyl-CoA dehydrogenase
MRAMDFELPEEMRMLQATLRRFVDTELIPIERQAYDGDMLKLDVRARLETCVKELGLWMYGIPVEYGGMGLGLLARVLIQEQLGRSIAIPYRKPSIFGPEPNGALFEASPHLKEKYLKPCLEGKIRMCFMQTEPDAGSDPANMKTRAVRDGDHYVVNGYKRFITNAGIAQCGQLLAVTDPAKGARGGISAFVVDMDAPGLNLVRQQQTMMDDQPWEVALDDVRIPAENLVGKEGDGFKFGQQYLIYGRMRHGAKALGTSERCLELAIEYAKQRVTFGQPLANRQSVQESMVNCWMELQAARLLLYRTAWRFDHGEDIRYDHYMCKVMLDEMAFRIVDRCMQVFGGIGFTTDLPIEKFWRDQRSLVTTEGPPEVMRMALARHVFRIY